MGVKNTLKQLLVPDSKPGVEYRCTGCGETFDTPRDRCEECGSIDVAEVEGTAVVTSS